MAEIIVLADLPTAIQSSEMVTAMVAGANAKASRVAPCLTWTGAADSDTPAPSVDQLAEAKLVLIGAIKRWVQAGGGAFSQQTAGPFSMSTDTRQRTGFNLWPSEITTLQEICATGGEAKAFSIDVAPSFGTSHIDWCSLNFGANYCSCGTDIAGYPIFEQS